jgi:hypothetical protein
MIFYFKRFENECIRKLAAGYRLLKYNEYIIVVTVNIIIILINLVYFYFSIHRRYSSIQQQFNSFTWWGWCSILAGFSRTIHPPSAEIVVLKGTPVKFKNFYNTKSNTCTRSIIRQKSIRILWYFLSPHFTFAFPQHAFLWYFGLPFSGSA